MMNQLHIYFQEGGGKKPEITEKPTGFSISRKCAEIAKIYNNQSLNSKNNLIIADKTIKFLTKRFDSVKSVMVRDVTAISYWDTYKE